MSDIQLSLPGKVKKLNVFIHTKYNTTREQDLIINHSLDHLRKDGNQLCAEINGNELAYILNINSKHNLSRTLKTAAQGLVGNTIIINGPDDEFEIFGIVTNAEYKDNTFSLTYNKKMTPYIQNVVSNYTILDRALEATFTTKYAVKIYELLKSEIFRLEKTGKPYLEVRYGFNELRCLLSLVNLEKPYIKSALDRKVSWDELVEKIAKPEDKKYNRVTEFKKYVLIPTMEELNEKSDIHFEFEDIRGTRGKIKEFIIRLSKTGNFDGNSDIPSDVLRSIEKLVSVSELDSAISKIKKENRIPTKQKKDLIELACAYNEVKETLRTSGVKELDPFNIEYFKTLWRKSGKDIQAIKDEIQYASKVENIKNYYGFLMSAVERKYSKSPDIETVEGSTEDAHTYREIRNAIDNMKLAEGSDASASTNEIVEEDDEPNSREEIIDIPESETDIREEDMDDSTDKQMKESVNNQIWKELRKNPEFKNLLSMFGMDEDTFENNITTPVKIKIFTEYLQRQKINKSKE